MSSCLSKVTSEQLPAFLPFYLFSPESAYLFQMENSYILQKN